MKSAWITFTFGHSSLNVIPSFSTCRIWMLDACDAGFSFQDRYVFSVLLHFWKVEYNNCKGKKKKLIQSSILSVIRRWRFTIDDNLLWVSIPGHIDDSKATVHDWCSIIMIWAERTSWFRYRHTYTMAAPWYYHMTLRVVIAGRKINVERPVDKMDFRSPHITSYPFWPVAFEKYISYLFQKVFQSSYQSAMLILSPII